MARRRGGIEIAQRLQRPSGSPLVASDSLPATDAGQRQPQRVVAKTGDVQMSAMEAFVPRQGQRADTASKADAHVIQPSRRRRKQLQQGRGGAPHCIGRAETVNVGFASRDPMEHMLVWTGGQVGASAAGNASRARENYSGPPEGQIEIWPLSAAVAMAYHHAALDRSVARPNQPTADPRALQRRKLHQKYAGVRARARDFLEVRRYIDCPGTRLKITPKRREIDRPLRRGNGEQRRQIVTVSGVEWIGMVKNRHHPSGRSASITAAPNVLNGVC